MLFKRSNKGAIGLLLVALLLAGYVVSAMDDCTLIRNKSEKLSKGHLCEVTATTLPYWIKEEALPPATVQMPVFLKAILPPAILSAKNDDERQYLITRLGLLPMFWNPTIPIAMRKITV